MNSRPVWTRSPRRMAADVLEQTFVGDSRLVARLVEQAQASLDTPNKHYNVLVGGRGVGKSHLLALVVARVRAARGDGPWCLAWLPDDPGGLAAPLHLYREILLQLGVEDFEFGEGAARDRQGATDRARQRLIEVLDGRPLLLCAERWDAVLDGFGDAGQRELRSFFQEERSCSLLATADRLTADFVDQERVFFGFFGVHRGSPLSWVEIEALLRARAEVDGAKSALAAWQELDVDERRSIVAALVDLLGPIPGRFVDLLRDGRDVADPGRMLLRALDQSDEDHRVATAGLSPQQRLLLHWLTTNPGAHPVKEVARACVISEQTVSPQLRVLRDAGIVRATRVGRETWYEPTDPLWGMLPEMAVELFGFLRCWYLDPELAGAEGGGIAEVLAGVDADSEDPRELLRLPRIVRRLAVAKGGGEADGAD